MVLSFSIAIEPEPAYRTERSLPRIRERTYLQATAADALGGCEAESGYTQQH